MSLLFKDSQFDFQALRLFSEAVYGSADVGEVIETAQRIGDDVDFQTWCTEWTKTAQRLHRLADDEYAHGHLIGARKAYLRAANYYRTAEFYLHENPDDPRILELYNSALTCFAPIMELNHPQIEAVKIPYEGTTLPGHYYHPEDQKEPRPVLLILTGFDGTKEELYGLAMETLEHGLNCLTVEGPGQGEVVRKQHLHFRPDYEAVVTPIVDYLVSRDDVDPKKIVLWGESFGGYLAPRAAAFEHRLAACIANEGILDTFTSFLGGLMKTMGVTKEELIAMAADEPQKVEKILLDVAKVSKQMHWGYTHGMYVFGVKTPAEFVLKAAAYNLEGIASKIQCPTLVVDSDADSILGGEQPKALYDALTCKKDYTLFTSAEGAGAHCECGAKLLGDERLLAWIDDTLRQN